MTSTARPLPAPETPPDGRPAEHAAGAIPRAVRAATPIAALAWAATVAGCVEEEPDPVVPTGDLVATIELEVVAAGETRVVVRLQDHATEDFYGIHGTDELLVIADGLQTSLVSSRLDDEPVYSAIHYADTPNVDFIVGFNRELSESAQSSRVQLSERLFPLWPEVVASSRAEDALEITWTPSESIEQMSLSAEGSCIVPWSVELDDIGARTIAPGTLTGTDTCDIRITLERRREGQIDDAYAGGSIVSRRPTVWEVSSTP